MTLESVNPNPNDTGWEDPKTVQVSQCCNESPSNSQRHRAHPLPRRSSLLGSTDRDQAGPSCTACTWGNPCSHTCIPASFPEAPSAHPRASTVPGWVDTAVEPGALSPHGKSASCCLDRTEPGCQASALCWSRAGPSRSGQTAGQSTLHPPEPKRPAHEVRKAVCPLSTYLTASSLLFCRMSSMNS